MSERSLNNRRAAERYYRSEDAIALHIWHRRVIRARRGGETCEGCGRTIKAGELVTPWTDRRFKRTIIHNDCRPDPLPERRR